MKKTSGIILALVIALCLNTTKTYAYDARCELYTDYQLGVSDDFENRYGALALSFADISREFGNYYLKGNGATVKYSTFLRESYPLCITGADECKVGKSYTFKLKSTDSSKSVKKMLKEIAKKTSLDGKYDSSKKYQSFEFRIVQANFLNTYNIRDIAYSYMMPIKWEKDCVRTCHESANTDSGWEYDFNITSPEKTHNNSDATKMSVTFNTAGTYYIMFYIEPNWDYFVASDTTDRLTLNEPKCIVHKITVKP